MYRSTEEIWKTTTRVFISLRVLWFPQGRLWCSQFGDSLTGSDAGLLRRAGPAADFTTVVFHWNQKPQETWHSRHPTECSELFWDHLLVSRGISSPSSIPTSLFQKGLLKAALSASKGPLSTANTWCHYQAQKAWGKGEATDLKRNFSWGEILEVCGSAFWCGLFKEVRRSVSPGAGWNKMPETQRERGESPFWQKNW